MSENTENLTLKLLQEMRGDMNDMRTEMRDGFKKVDEQLTDVNTRIDGVMHLMSFLAGRSHNHEERIENLEVKK